MTDADAKPELENTTSRTVSTVTYRLEPDDLRRLMSSFPAWQRFGEFWIIIFGSAPGLILLAVLGYEFAFVACLGFTVIVLARASLNRVDVVDDLDFAHIETTRISIYDQFLEHSSAVETSMRHWAGLRAVSVHGDDILVHVKKFVRMLIPARAFANERDRKSFFQGIQAKISEAKRRTEQDELPRFVLDPSAVSVSYEQNGWELVQGQNKLAQSKKAKKLGLFWSLMLTIVPFLIAFAYMFARGALGQLGGNNFLFELIAFLCFMGITTFASLAVGKIFMRLMGEPASFARILVAVDLGSEGVEVRTPDQSTFCPWGSVRPIRILPANQLLLINKIGFVLAMIPSAAFNDQRHREEFLRLFHIHRSGSIEEPAATNLPPVEDSGNPFQPPRDWTGR